MGDEILITLAVAPVVPPVIFSPLVNVPDEFVKVNCGATASVDASSESNTATTLNTSARPSEIVASEGRVPKASVVPETTFTCFIRLTVLLF